MGLLDIIIGCFFCLPNSDMAVYYSSQGRVFLFVFYPTLTWLCTIPRRGVFFCFYAFLPQMVIFDQKKSFVDKIF